MKGCSKVRSRGFTIIETMVYLAIAGVMFLITIFYLGGKQRSTQFNQGVRDFESTLNDVANDTSTGVFPSLSNVVCTTSGVSIILKKTTPINGNDAVLPGENNKCIFVGNVVQLVHDSSAGPASDLFVHTLIGKNTVSSGDNIFGTITPAPLYNIDEGIDATRDISIPWGVQITKAYAQTTSGKIVSTPINSVGYLYSSFGASLASGSSIKTGVASVSLYVKEDNSELSLDGFRKSINQSQQNNVNAELLDTLGSRVIHICLLGLDGRQAMIEIGGESGSFIARANFNPSAECTS